MVSSPWQSDEQRDGKKAWRFVPAVLAALLGVALSWGAFAAVREWETRERATDFAAAVRNRTSVFHRALDDCQFMLQSVAGFCARSREKGAKAFDEFARPMLRHVGGTRALAWSERVAPTSARRQEAGSPATVAVRHVVPADVAWVDGELIADSRSLAARRRSRDTGLPTVVIKPAPKASGTPSLLLVFQATYRGGVLPPDADRRRTELIGYAVGVFDLREFVESSLECLEPQGVDMGIYAVDESGARRFVYQHWSRLRGPVALGHDAPATVSGGAILREEPVDFWGDRWILRCTPAPGAFHGGDRMRSGTVLASGLLLTLGLAGYLVRSIGRTARTERLVAERTAQLRRSEETARALLNASVDAAYLLDTEGAILAVNESAAHACGRPASELLGQGVANVLPGDLASDAPHCISRIIETHEPVQRETDADGRAFVGTFYPIFSTTGRVAQLALYVRDVTERMRGEAVRSQLAAIVEGSDDAIIGKTLEGMITSWNGGAERIYGYSREEAVGRSISVLVPPDRPDELAEQIFDKLRRGERVDHYETERIRKDGARIHVSLTISPITDANGRIIGASTIARDITERKRAEEAAQQHQIELAHASRLSTMGEMASELAHELNQPLGAITTYADACRKMLDSGRHERVAAIVDDISEQAHQAAEILRRVRGFVRKQSPLRTGIDVNQVVREVVGLVAPEARKHGITIALELADDLPAVEADPIQLQQVVLNLARNGFDAIIREGGDRRRLTIRSESDGAAGITVHVIDTGCGFAGGSTERLFEPFYTTKPQGMGMGLSICQSIVKSHGGRLEASPRDEGGAVFRLTLPAKGGVDV